MFEIIKNIVNETLNIYSLATLGGKVFIPFFICCVYLVLSGKKEHNRARKYFVYPSIILILIVFNPVLIHFLYKYIEVEERIVRIYWPLPMAGVIVYCVVEVFFSLKDRWKRTLLVLCAVFAMLLCSGFEHSGMSYGKAENMQKMPKGTKEVCDIIYELNLHEPADVAMTAELFFWVRQYNSSILVPTIRSEKFWYDEGVLDLDKMAQMSVENNCKYLVLNSGKAVKGSVEAHGYALKTSVEAQDSVYLIYTLEK